jgi:AcrR family transcriptional regulator
VSPRAGLDRAAVTEHALAVVDAGGPEAWQALSLAAVAARAGVAVPSLYKHVEGLPGLRREVALRAVTELDDVVATAAATTDDPDARLRAVAHAIRDWARRRPARYQAVQGGWLSHADAGEVHATSLRAVDRLAALVAALGVPPERRVDAVRAVRAGVHGFVVLELEGGFGMSEDVGTSFAYLVDGLVAGLRRAADGT